MRRYVRILTCFIQQMWLLVAEAPVVIWFIKSLKPDALSHDHAWVTGKVDGDDIWPKNIVYRSESKLGFNKQDDDEVVTKVGQFLRSMVKRSVREVEIPQSPKRRMPHAVNYIHGSVHFNGAFAIFDDFDDLVFHITDKAFRRDLRMFVKQEKREITFVLRDRDYDPTAYAYCIAAIRAYLPYFTNGNGPTKDPVLWGNKSPYAALNPINGAWMRDLWLLQRGRLSLLARPPITKRYFADRYAGVRRGPTRIELTMAWLMFLDVRARGAQGQIFFSRRGVYDPKGLEEYKALGYWRGFTINRVPKPWRTEASPRNKVSVIVPTLNEELNITPCLESIRRAFGEAEVIVADGHSQDATCVLAEAAGAQVVRCGPGRGTQLREAARRATGDVLVFVHADSRVAPDAGKKLDRFFAKSESRQICTMRLRFDRKNPAYKLLGWATRLDGYMFSYGDQGIAIRRDFYEGIGEFPDQPLFEDVELLRNARRVTRIHSLNTRIRVSARRFNRRGLFRELSHNTRLMKRYARGESVESLRRAYRNA